MLFMLFMMLTFMRQATKPGGKVMIIGMGTPVLTLPISAAALREVDLVGVFRYANTYKEVIQLLSSRPKGMPDLSTLITQRFKGMDRIEDAFNLAERLRMRVGTWLSKSLLT